MVEGNESENLGALVESDVLDEPPPLFTQKTNTKRIHVEGLEKLDLLNHEHLQTYCKWAATLKSAMLHEERPAGDTRKDC